MARITPVDDRASRSHILKSLSIIAGFLDEQSFEFVDDLNCIIGARRLFPLFLEKEQKKKQGAS